jgi:hypothetical protein
MPDAKMALSLPPMAKRKEGERTVLKGFRLKESVVARLEAYAARHPLQPSEAKIVEAALVDWFVRNEPLLEAALELQRTVPPQPPPAKPPRGKA